MENSQYMAAFQNEKEKLERLFEKVELERRELVQGLIEQAAFLYAENARLQRIVSDHGGVVINPARPTMQRPTEAAKLYLKNSNAYAVTIKALNGIMQKNTVEEDDEFDKFMQEQRERYAD